LAAGIGTYIVGPLTNSKGGWITRARNGIAKLHDQGFGSSFVDHVIAGYEFLLRFYAPGDTIYFFGFSRGAYTARFLAEMIDTIGLLSQGNEEMIRFAWDTYSEFQQLGGSSATSKEVKEDFIKDSIERRYTEHKPVEFEKSFLQKLKGFFAKDNKTIDEASDFLQTFKSTFCRADVKVFFLGLFDCVNSVAQFARHKAGTSPFIPKAPATYIRHAVSMHERRSMFTPALFLIEGKEQKIDAMQHKNTVKLLKEVYFVGNHGDIGGGWPIEKEKAKKTQGKQGKTQEMWNKDTHYNHVLSDIALRWMVDEAREVGKHSGVSLELFYKDFICYNESHNLCLL
jgi:uncharacterized protein (DUF2235 family)